MSVRIVLDQQPEFYTNLDSVSGRVLLGLNRAEQISSIVVKLEGEAVTALQVPHPTQSEFARHGPPPGPPGSVVAETHKLLYKVQQVFPDDYYASSNSPYGAHPLHPGEHTYPFTFKLPVNNACSDPMAMSKLGGLGGLGGFGSGGGLFGMGGVRVMDGSKQLFLKHTTRTLPPSLMGFPGQAEIRYFIKVTIQRPSFLKENWRFQAGFKFMPIESPRPALSGQETFARRPFTFRGQAGAGQQPDRRRSLFFNNKKGDDSKSPVTPDTPGATANDAASAPSVEIAARLPHPPILTCNKPVPLRLLARKLADHPDQVYLVSLQIELIGYTELRAHGIHQQLPNRWIIVSKNNLEIPVPSPASTESEYIIPDAEWNSAVLPNTVTPSFTTCNLTRRYELEVKIGLAWGPAKSSLLKSNTSRPTIYLPLHFNRIEVFSGIQPPPGLLEAAKTKAPGQATVNLPPRLPPRTATAPVGSTTLRPPVQSTQTQAPPQAPDPLYPPQLGPGQVPDDAPPSYDEATADDLAGPFDGFQSRPAYSGVTNENAPSQMPEKN